MRLYYSARIDQAIAIPTTGIVDDLTPGYVRRLLDVSEAVRLASEPLHVNDGEADDRDVIVAVELPDDFDASVYELIDEVTPYREFFIPAHVLNRVAVFEVVEYDVYGQQEGMS